MWLEGSLLVGTVSGQGTGQVEKRELARELGTALGVRTRHICRADQAYIVELPDGNARAAAARAVQGVTISLTIEDTAADCQFTPRDVTLTDVDVFIMTMRAGAPGGMLSAEGAGNPMPPDEWIDEVHAMAQEEQRRAWMAAGAGGLLQGMLLNPGAQPEHIPTVMSLSDDEMRQAIMGMQQLLLQRAAGVPRPPPVNPIPQTPPGQQRPRPPPSGPSGTGTPSTPFQSLDGWTLAPQKPLRFRVFSGPEKLKPDHATWEQWRREVLLAQGQYPESAVKESMERSLVGDPLEIAQGFPLDLSVPDMLARLEDFFGPVQELDQVRSSFHQIQMKSDERVSELVTRIEMWARRVNTAAGREEVAPSTMKSRLFHALRDHLKAQVRHLKDNTQIDYKELVRYLRVIESGTEGAGRMTKKTAAVKLHQVEPVEPEEQELPPLTSPVSTDPPPMVGAPIPQLDVATGGLDLQQAVIQAVAAQIATQFGLRPGGATAQQRGGQQRRSRRGGRGRGRGAQGAMPSTTTPANARVQNRELICHLCGGAGHMARHCSSQAGSEQGNAQGDEVMGASQSPAPQVQGQAAPQRSAPQRSATQ